MANSFERIYAVVKKIPRGTVASYGQVALLAGNPRWARVVGYALHANPDPEGIPCYRVVTKDGRTSQLNCGALRKFCALTSLCFHGNTQSITAKSRLVRPQNLLVNRSCSIMWYYPDLTNPVVRCYACAKGVTRMIDIEKLTALAIAYDAGDAKRIQHFIKVYAYSRLLGRREGLEEQKQNVLEAAAVLHDIGIHEAERKHGSSGGHWQEMEGPAVAAPMLQQCGADERESERVQWLIAHHHTYTAGEEKDFRILLEADFLVNAYEDGMTAEQCKTAKDRVFRTETGKQYLEEMFLKPAYQAK